MISPRTLARHRVFVGSNRELFRLSAMLVLWTSLLLSILSNPWVREIFIDRLALCISLFLAVLLQILGNEVETVGVIIRTDAFSMEISHKCTAVYQAAVFCAGVFAYRTGLRNKSIGLLWGISAISVANVIRIMGIFYVGVYCPRWIPFVHNVLGEALMIILVLFAWYFWAKQISGAVPGGS